MRRGLHQREGHMLWLFFIIIILGFLIGCFFRVSALLLVSAIFVIVTVVYGNVAGWSFGNAVIFAIGLIIALQLSYIIGLWLSSTSVRTAAVKKAFASWSFRMIRVFERT